MLQIYFVEYGSDDAFGGFDSQEISESMRKRYPTMIFSRMGVGRV